MGAVMASGSGQRGSFTGALGFILAAAGSAVGLGNIWRFPYRTGENGGAAFLVIYLLIVVVLGLPLLMNEIAIGRRARKNPVDALRVLGGGPFVVAGYLSILACFLVLSYYSVIGGWTIYYGLASVVGKQVVFGEFVQDMWKTGIVCFVFLFLTVLIVQGGVSGGIELASKILMPVLFFLVVGLAVYSLSLPGSWSGVEFYLSPDLSEVTATTWLQALGQAFFSLSVGWGLMITYGSYFSREGNIPVSSAWIAFADTMVAFLAGLIVFPAVFAMGMDPAGGVGLTFQTLPEVFERMGAPWTQIIGASFFFLLSIAALTSSISMLEVPVSFVVDRGWLSRRTASVLIGGLAFLVGIPSLLSFREGSVFSRVWVQERTIRMEQVGYVRFHDLVAGETYEVVEEGGRVYWRIQERAHRKPMVEIVDEQGHMLRRIELKPGDQLLVTEEGQKVEAGTVIVRRMRVFSFLDFMDFVFGSLVIILIALLLALFTGWRGKAREIIDEISRGAPWFRGLPSSLWLFVVRFIAPIAILLMLIFTVTE